MQRVKLMMSPRPVLIWAVPRLYDWHYIQGQGSRSFVIEVEAEAALRKRAFVCVLICDAFPGPFLAIPRIIVSSRGQTERV